MTWTASPSGSTADWYREFAEVDVRGVSPRYEVLCLGVAGDAEVCALLDSLPSAKRQPNLLLAAVRFLGGPIDAWADFRAFVFDRWVDVAQTMRQRRTQTNEARRSSALLPVLAGLPQPLALLEVGAAAGLCLFPDRWSYRYQTGDGDHVVGEGPELRCRASGPVPLPERPPEVVWRGGLDLHPLDVRREQDMRWLEALIWPERTDRLAVLRAAIAIARADPPAIRTGDLTVDLPGVAADAPPEATLVVFHTAVLAYVDDPGRAAFTTALRALAVVRPVCWLANEAPGVLPQTQQWRGRGRARVLTRDGLPIAGAGAHGDTLDWFE
ncbi:MAG: DUF2332 domain-containing protein [Geodermatophilaceae bacterium]|nr:DUF2332 domain-containing protein [Geodermatophilaceae bacterium]